MNAHFRFALISLKRNKVRTGLTTLGIIIGVASMTLVLSLSEGAKQTVAHQVRDLGNNIILVEPGQQATSELSAYNPYTTPLTSSLTESDLESVADVPGVQAVAPTMLLSGSVAGDEKSLFTSIIATTPELIEVLNLKVGSGQFIDESINRDTVILGEDLAVELFGTNRTTGQRVKLKGREHTVIGVLRGTDRPINFSGLDLDHAAFISLEDGKSYNQGLAQLQQLTIQIVPDQDLAKVSALTEQALIKNHDGEKDFNVLAGPDIAHSADSLFRSVTAITTIISLVTLVVGGIGVMNIMLVSVAERTREIGIRKAVGATDQHILWQFLIESLLMSVTAGVIGVALASGLAYAIALQLSFQPVISAYVITAGVSSAVLVGLVFGMYPAIKASRKNPILALRQYQ